GNYQGHYEQGRLAKVQIAEKAKNHPILVGIKPFTTMGGLYKNPGLAKDVRVLLTASSSDHTEPVAWTRIHNGGRGFYTSLGTPEDFKDENFGRMLVNAIFWTTKRDLKR